MVRNYLKVALRNILKYKFFAGINILGMTVGITACLLIMMFVQDELSFDGFHERAARIYEVGLHGKIGGQDLRVANTCPPMAAALIAEVPEVEDATRITPYFREAAVKVDDKAFVEKRLFYADPNFFNFFSFRLVEGDPKTALKEPNTIVLTPAMARKYFGEASAVGKLIVIGNNDSFKVTGIAEEAPSNSSLRYDFLLSSASYENLKDNRWFNNFTYTYFTVREKANVANIDGKLSKLVEKYVGPELEKFMGITLKQLKTQGGDYGYFITALPDIHLRATAEGELGQSGNILYVYSFSTIAVFIMVIACINFMNMSTARSAGRAKEVGLRKTLGSLREQMIAQFLAESMIYSLLAMVLAVLAAYLLLPSFNTLSGKGLGFSSIFNFKFISIVLAVIVFVGLVAGSYPAFYLTSFKVVEVLKGKVRAGAKSRGVRSGLVIFQFAISIFLIIATAIVFNQLSYMQARDLGFDKSHVLYLYNIDKLGTGKDAFRNSISQQSNVSAVSFTNNGFPGVGNTTVFKSPGNNTDHIMGLFSADYEQQKVMKFTMAKGRYFSKDFPSDSSAIIINETAAKEFGFENAINDEIIYGDDGRQKRYKVVGVFKDFNFETLKDKVRPLAVMLNTSGNLLAIRYQGNSKDIIAAVEDQWHKVAASDPLQYKFLDENYDELFRSEQRLGKIFSVFSGLAIFIASLGLFALAAFTAEQRTKEIGIRKVMGASVSALAMMMSKEFIVLVMIAFGLAVVPTWFAVQWWLGGFAYRTEVNPMIFVLAGVGAIGLAWLTVSYQSLRAAAADPVKSIRYE